MGKKNVMKSLPWIYLIGLAAVVIGFCCPVFKGVLGSTSNGFDLINFDNFGWSSLGVLLIAVGAVAGLVFCFVPMKNARILRLICLVVSIVGGVILVIGFSGIGASNGIEKFAKQTVGKGFFKHAYVGFWTICAGWVVSLVGWIIKK